VLNLPFMDGRSTTGIVERILERYGSESTIEPS
jgi:cytochrome c-type biogenesis protein CcmH/NrfF